MAYQNIGSRVQKRRSPSNPFQLVRFFEGQLREQNVPIQFEASLNRECRHAKALLRLCKGRRQEAEALIQEFMKDAWERKHNRSLSRVASMADELRTRIIERQRKKPLPNTMRSL